MRHGFVAPIFRAGVKKQRRFRNISRYQLLWIHSNIFLSLKLAETRHYLLGGKKSTYRFPSHVREETHTCNVLHSRTRKRIHTVNAQQFECHTQDPHHHAILFEISIVKKRQIHKQTRTNSKEIKNTNGKRVSQFTQIILLLRTFWILIGCRFGLLHHGACASVSAASKNHKCFPNSSASDGTKSYLRPR